MYISSGMDALVVWSSGMDALVVWSSGMDALVVWQSTSGTVFRDPASRCFFVQKVELDNADMDGAPLSFV
jgi:hypothetical protein